MVKIHISNTFQGGSGMRLINGCGKIFLLFLCVLALGTYSASAAEDGKDKKVIHLLSTPFGTGSYVLGTALENIINKGDYGLQIAHAETPGQAYNVNKLAADPEARKNTAVTASQGINWLAEKGMKPFTDKRDPLKLIGVYTYTGTWLASDDKNIKDIKDLKGKRIAMGRIPQVIWGYEPDAILKNGYDPDFYKSLNKQMVGTAEAATALVNGQVDAATIGGYLDPVTAKFSPSPQTVEVLASGRNLNHLDWTKEAIEKTAEKDVPLFVMELPPNTVEGQDKPIWIGADLHGLFAHPDMSDEDAYILAKAMIENIDKFAQYHALGGLMSKEGLVKGFTPDKIHPGALKAYREAGIIKD